MRCVGVALYGFGTVGAGLQRVLRARAAVGGAIPILRVLRGALAGNRISRIRGILNGTCTYILSRIATDGIPPETALHDAQALGFAEADPGLDVSGMDSVHKLQILARHAFGEWPADARVECQGIEDVSLAGVQEAAGEGALIRAPARHLQNLTISPSLAG